MIEIIQHIIALFYLITGSISDLKMREVADWSNYGLIALGVCLNTFFSVVFLDWTYLLYSAIGLGVFWVISAIMYYTGQWGGGDAKLLMGLGALYGVGWQWSSMEFMVSFFVNTLVAGAVYGIFWSLYLAIVNRKAFVKAYHALNKQKLVKFGKLASLGILLLSGVLYFVLPNSRLLALGVAMLITILVYLSLIIKAVEQSCMHKLVAPSALTIGDWIAKEVKHKGKLICGPKDLGISQKQINQLKKIKVKKVLIKEGIPFVPSFLLGWIISVFFGNIFLGLL